MCKYRKYHRHNGGTEYLCLKQGENYVWFNTYDNFEDGENCKYLNEDYKNDASAN